MNQSDVLDQVLENSTDLVELGFTPDDLVNDCADQLLAEKFSFIDKLEALGLAFGVAVVLILLVLVLYRFERVRKFIHPLWELLALPILIIRRTYKEVKDYEGKFQISTSTAIVVSVVGFGVLHLSGQVFGGAVQLIGTVYTVSLSLFGVPGG